MVPNTPSSAPNNDQAPVIQTAELSQEAHDIVLSETEQGLASLRGLILNVAPDKFMNSNLETEEDVDRVLLDIEDSIGAGEDVSDNVEDDKEVEMIRELRKIDVTDNITPQDLKKMSDYMVDLMDLTAAKTGQSKNSLMAGLDTVEAMMEFA